MSTEDGLRAQANLKKLFDQRQQELNKKQTDIEKQSADLEKQSKLVSKDAYTKKREELQKQALEYQAVAMEYSKELDKKQKELTDPIVERMLGIVKRIATTENYDIVVDSSPTMAGPWGAVAYARTDLDLTDKCIQMYNSGGVSGGGAPASSGSAAPKK
jgi:outer membrane protein